MTQRPLRIVVGGPLPSTFPRAEFEDAAEFRVTTSGEELRAAIHDADILFSGNVPETVPSETPRLAWVQVPSAGVDYLRDLPVWRSDILITASQGIHTVPLTDHVFALLLALTRGLPAFTRAQDRHEWLNPRAAGIPVTELRGKTMGILGWGKIGNGVAHVARAFGMRVIGTRWSVHTPREPALSGASAYADPPWLQPTGLPPDIVYPAIRQQEVLEESDVVVMILPLTRETAHSFGDEQFNAMKRGSIFINIGRGAVVDEDALVRALKSGRLAGAGLDVFDHEPLSKESPLWDMHNVTITPHVGGMSERTRERAAEFFAVNLSRYLQGHPLLNVVDRRQEY